MDLIDQGKKMVAYCGPGDTVTSFYALVGEQADYRLKSLILSMPLAGLAYGILRRFDGK